jgi:hypothetical protein
VNNIFYLQQFIQRLQTNMMQLSLLLYFSNLLCFVCCTTIVDNEIRKANVYKAKLAEQSLRFDDVLSVMMSVSEMDQSLAYEERTLLSTSYKKSIETRLFSYKVVQQVEDTEHGEFLDIAKDYRMAIGNEIFDISNKVLFILANNLIPNASDIESKVLFLTMTGESYRYIAEIKDENKTETIELATVSYADAIDIARTALTGMNLIRLELALSYSMFYHDIMNDIDRAIEIASSEFHCAIVELDGTEHDTIDAIFQLIRVLRDKIDLWSEENDVDSR